MRYNSHLRDKARRLRRNLTDSEVIEVDGSQHLVCEHALQDRSRDRYLGLKVLRFNSREVLEESNAVVEVIDRTVAEQLRAKIPPGPPLLKGGEEGKVG